MTNFILNVDNEMQNGGEKLPFSVNVLRAVHKFLQCPPVLGPLDSRDRVVVYVVAVISLRSRQLGSRPSLHQSGVRLIEIGQGAQSHD
jgi:hypothetical protein